MLPGSWPVHIVLLGASGFVGGAMLRQSRRLDCKLRVLVHKRVPPKLPVDATAFAGSVERLPAGLLPDEPHVLIHCATKQVDADGTGFAENQRAVEALCGQLNPHTKAVLYASSCSVYGAGPHRGVDEGQPLNPSTALAQSRAECEARLALLGAQGRCRVETFRPRFIVGSGDRFMLPMLMRLTSRRLTIGSGQQRYSVIDVDDYARVLLSRAEAAVVAMPGFEAFNVAYDRPLSLQHAQLALAQHLGLRRPCWRIPAWRGLASLLSHSAFARLRRLGELMSLVGQDQFLSTRRLGRELPGAWLSVEPMTALQHAIDRLPPRPA